MSVQVVKPQTRNIGFGIVDPSIRRKKKENFKVLLYAFGVFAVGVAL
jgi:hypothetical protein